MVVGAFGSDGSSNSGQYVWHIRRGVMIYKEQIPPTILQMVREANLQVLIFLHICRETRVRVGGNIHSRIIAFALDLSVIVQSKLVCTLCSLG
jgi:hypothetical protein